MHCPGGLEAAVHPQVRRLVQELQRCGFECYSTDVGGPGVRCYDTEPCVRNASPPARQTCAQARLALQPGAASHAAYRVI